jgi:hypothetical protein
VGDATRRAMRALSDIAPDGVARIVSPRLDEAAKALKSQ